MNEREQKAMAVASDKDLLLRRLLQARAVLRDEYRPFFKTYTYDFAGRCLRGRDGYVLRWRLRAHPEQPETYDNQQTSAGDVYLGKEG